MGSPRSGVCAGIATGFPRTHLSARKGCPRHCDTLIGGTFFIDGSKKFPIQPAEGSTEGLDWGARQRAPPRGSIGVLDWGGSFRVSTLHELDWFTKGV